MGNSKQADLVLIHPGNRTQIYQSLGSTLSAIEPQVWASFMATFVRQHGFSALVLDAEVEDLAPEDVSSLVADINPLLAAIVVYGHQPSSSTQNRGATSAICSALKE